jgi:hypothetical protein
MKKIFPIFVLGLIGLACSKKESADPANSVSGNSGCVVAEITDSASNKKSSSFTIDANRRVTKVQNYKDGVPDDYTTISYSNGTMTAQGFNKGGVAEGNPQTFPVNSNGTSPGGISADPDTVFGTGGIKTAGTRKDTSVYTYDSNNRLLTSSSKSTTYDNSNNQILRQRRSSESYTYTGNKVTKSIGTYSNKEGTSPFFTSTSTRDYTYDESSPTVKVNPVVGLQVIFGNLLGSIQADKIPVKVKSSYNSGTSSTDEYNTTYTAVVDSKGNPTRIRAVSSSTGSSSVSISTYNYTYSCP